MCVYEPIATIYIKGPIGGNYVMCVKKCQCISIKKKYLKENTHALPEPLRSSIFKYLIKYFSNDSVVHSFVRHFVKIFYYSNILYSYQGGKKRVWFCLFPVNIINIFLKIPNFVCIWNLNAGCWWTIKTFHMLLFTLPINHVWHEPEQHVYGLYTAT